jgi:hypothetical protein
MPAVTRQAFANNFRTATTVQIGARQSTFRSSASGRMERDRHSSIHTPCCSTCDDEDKRPSAHPGWHFWEGDTYFIGTPHELNIFYPVSRAELARIPTYLLEQIYQYEFPLGSTAFCTINGCGVPKVINHDQMTHIKFKTFERIAEILGKAERIPFPPEHRGI